METLILFILAFIGILMAILSAVKPILDDNRIRGKVLNFSEGMKEYFFLLEQGKEETEEALAGPLEQPVLAYTYLPEEETVRFRRDNVEADYRLRFREAEGKNYLSVSRVAGEREKGNIPYLVNAFFIKNLRAKPVEYWKFQAMFEDED